MRRERNALCAKTDLCDHISSCQVWGGLERAPPSPVSMCRWIRRLTTWKMQCVMTKVVSPPSCVVEVLSHRGTSTLCPRGASQSKRMEVVRPISPAWRRA